jgi:nitroimidazol reductase NimA-like FMN-containing flavoprotein (pyridoxamine 5'-phosphate oxidase superfamily)
MNQASSPAYPQMPPLTADELEAFLKQPLIAKLATHNEDGTIHLTALTFLYKDGEFLFGTQDITQKVKNVQRNGNVTLLIDTTERPFKGVMVYGKAVLDYDSVVEKRIEIFSKAMPPENAQGFAHALANKWKPVIIRVTPVSMISYDYSKGSLV